jgi:hypothetical protein
VGVVPKLRTWHYFFQVGKVGCCLRNYTILVLLELRKNARIQVQIEFFLVQHLPSSTDINRKGNAKGAKPSGLRSVLLVRIGLEELLVAFVLEVIGTLTPLRVEVIWKSPLTGWHLVREERHWVETVQRGSTYAGDVH